MGTTEQLLIMYVLLANTILAVLSTYALPIETAAAATQLWTRRWPLAGAHAESCGDDHNHNSGPYLTVVIAMPWPSPGPSS